MKEYRLNMDKKLLKPISPLISIIIAFFAAGVVVWITGGNPIEAYSALIKGAFGSMSGLKNTIRYTIPIIMLGFSFSICEKCGYFNIGQEGQMYGAALAVALIQHYFSKMPDFALIPIMLLGAIIVSGIICLIPAVLKFLFGVNEVIIAMLLNYILILFTNFMLLYSPIAETGKSTAMSITITPVVSGIILVIIAAFIIISYAAVMKKSVPGYRLRMVGYNATFTKASGLKTIKIMLIAAFLGGAFSGLSVCGEVFGVYHKVYNGFAENLGFYGMTAALIGGQSTLGLVMGAMILGALQSGSVSLAVMTDVPSEIVLVVQGFVMLFATINVLQLFRLPKKKVGGM